MTYPVRAHGSLPFTMSYPGAPTTPRDYYATHGNALRRRWWSPSVAVPTGAVPQQLGYALFHMVPVVPEFAGAPIESFLGMTADSPFYNLHPANFTAFGVFALEGGCGTNPPGDASQGGVCRSFNYWLSVLQTPAMIALFPTMIAAIPGQPRRALPNSTGWWQDGSTPDYIAMALLGLRLHLHEAHRTIESRLQASFGSTASFPLVPGDVFTVALAYLAFARGSVSACDLLMTWVRQQYQMESTNLRNRAQLQRARWGLFLQHFLGRLHRGEHWRGGGGHRHNPAYSVIRTIQRLYSGRQLSRNMVLAHPPNPPTSVNPDRWFDTGFTVSDELNVFGPIADAATFDIGAQRFNMPSLRQDYLP